jgi:8-oxo-dGTP pyrophosphatase MutT (NUDIX family)
VVKEATATAFVFRADEQGAWRLGLMFHPRFSGWLTPGGHVERDESPAEAVTREVMEELGCKVRLLPGPSAPLPAGYPHHSMPAPWWMVEMLASPDNHTRVPHIHLDHAFVAVHVADACSPETRVRWVSERELAEAADVPEDVRLAGKGLFADIGDLAGSAGRSGAAGGR